MASKKFSPVPKSEREEIFDALLGTPEEMDEESAEAFLEGYGIDSAQLVSDMKERVAREARKLRVAGKDEPITMRNALRSLREAERHGHESPQVDPETWIGKLLSGDLGSVGRAEVVYSFRNRKGDLSENDRAVLDALNAELANESEEDKEN